MVCPTHKTRNLILSELANTATLNETKTQAVKASQCLQVGCNLAIGYYSLIDSVGLATIVHMTAGVTTTSQQGKGHEELEEVCLMADQLYQEQRLVQDEGSLHKTLQAMVQCANSCLADFDQSPTLKSDKGTRVGKDPL